MKQADWPGVVSLCKEALSAETKDLRVAVHLLEGLANTQGFAGLAEGLELVARLIDEAWERLNPPLAEGDVDERAAPLANMLDDPDHGLRFPRTVRAIPLLGGYGYTAWLALRTSSSPADQQAAAAAIASLTLSKAQELDRQIGDCQKELKTLLAACDRRMGAEAPSLSSVAAALDDCRRVAAQELQRLAQGAPSADGELSATGPERHPLAQRRLYAARPRSRRAARARTP